MKINEKYAFCTDQQYKKKKETEQRIRWIKLLIDMVGCNLGNTRVPYFLSHSQINCLFHTESKRKSTFILQCKADIFNSINNQSIYQVLC